MVTLVFQNVEKRTCFPKITLAAFLPILDSAFPMKFNRIIAKLDIKGPNLVKGIRLEGLRVLGKPEDFARLYYQQGADELIFIDAVASLYGRNNLAHIIEKTSREIFIPMTVGGGLRTIDDIREVLRAGADKVALNTAAIKTPDFISQAARVFGSSTIVVAIDAGKKPQGNYEVFTNYGRQSTGLDAFAWARQAVELGAGELLITSIDRDGTGNGFDLDLVTPLARDLGVPVIAVGGAGKLDHISEVIQKGRADAITAASMLHYKALKELHMDEKRFQEEGNISFLKSLESFKRVEGMDIATMKNFLKQKGIACRE